MILCQPDWLSRAGLILVGQREKETLKIGLKPDVNMKPKSDPLICILNVLFEDLLYNKIYNTKVIYVEESSNVFRNIFDSFFDDKYYKYMERPKSGRASLKKKDLM